MKRLLISLAAAALMPAFAQTANPGAKVDPKNNKVGKPVVEKPKAKLLSRDQLRSCIEMSEANSLEADAVKADQNTYKDTASALKAERDALQKADEAAGVALAEMKAEREGILKEFENIKAYADNKDPRPDPEVLAARNKAYQERAKAFDTRVNSINENNAKSNEARKAFGVKVDALNASFKALEERQENHLDKVDTWKQECGNKQYDEEDEKAIKKERAAAGK
ncbi:hypothetical protein [Paucibacter sp. DJ2R-2]|uniref:hypothetical protein n=1 Tax=Paucibacter sp. DJ2R-2 TaxID=2893558 RepID=UPI0021E4B766|nr:hypothetical protein [Paucibacter sp. DJ2R-2]MCV2420715.1 hypothetical protein [Paucibacter sp. DJ4R-1]MCV2439914.1 hypothetical protein [Paucibacter sp. DJ2R-2]